MEPLPLVPAFLLVFLALPSATGFRHSAASSITPAPPQAAVMAPLYDPGDLEGAAKGALEGELPTNVIGDVFHELVLLNLGTSFAGKWRTPPLTSQPADTGRSFIAGHVDFMEFEFFEDGGRFGCMATARHQFSDRGARISQEISDLRPSYDEEGASLIGEAHCPYEDAFVEMGLRRMCQYRFRRRRDSLLVWISFQTWRVVSISMIAGRLK